jgi:hypothetical protein
MLPVLSPEQACDLHCELVLWTSRTLCAAKLGAVVLSVAGDVSHPLFQQCRQLGAGAVQRQMDGNLGDRMYQALQQGLHRYSKVVVVGSDCPQLDRRYLQQALAELDETEVVLGPAKDGGYVLLGVRRVAEHWFDGIQWGEDTVYADTAARLDATGTGWRALPVLQDIDRPEDLALWRDVANRDG